MKMICPECGIMGYTQIRKQYARIAHYRGFKGESRLVDWHSTTIEELQKVNPQIVINNVINESQVFVINGRKANSTLLTSYRQTHNLEFEGPSACNQKSRARIPPPAPLLKYFFNSSFCFFWDIWFYCV